VTESQKASHKDNRYSNKDSKVYPRGNEVPNTQREDSRTEDNNIPGWFKNVAENFKFPSSVGSAMNSDNKESLEKGVYFMKNWPDNNLPVIIISAVFLVTTILLSKIIGHFRIPY
jgi:hypothetical protein